MLFINYLIKIEKGKIKDWLLQPITNLEFKQLSKDKRSFSKYKLLLLTFEIINLVKQDVREAVKKHFNIK